MAYVKITEAVIDRTAANVAEMRRRAFQQLTVTRQATIQPGQSFYPAFRRALDAAMWEGAEHLRDQIPERWMVSCPHVGIKVIGRDDALYFDGWISADSTGPIVTINTPGDWIIHPHHVQPADAPHFDAFVGLVKKAEDADQQYKEVEYQIVTFLRTHNSLNRALKEMPELEMYLAQEDLDRVKKQASRKAKAPNKRDTPEVDRDTIAALGVAHRLNTARG